MKKANYAPVYAALYPALTELVRNHGYALAVHGSLARDFDVICVAWNPDGVSSPETVVKDITTQFTLKQIGEPVIKQYNRLVYTLSIGFGDCFLDFSFIGHPTDD